MKIADALRRRDRDDLLALYAPVIETRTPEGEIWNRERAVAYAIAGIEQARESRLIINTIVRLLHCGDRAMATVLQQWYRTQSMGGAVRNVETAAVQDEEWQNPRRLAARKRHERASGRLDERRQTRRSF